MNREKAIEIFKRLKENAPNEMHLETVGTAQELFDMAIQALSQEPCRVKNELNVELNELKPCDDAISHAGLLDLANAIESDDSGYWTNKRISSALRNISSVTQKPIECDDAISREMALKECHDIVVDGERYRVIQEETLLGLPPVTPSCDKCAMNGSGSKYCDNCKQKSGKCELKALIDKHRMYRLAYDELSEFERDVLELAESEDKE